MVTLVPHNQCCKALQRNYNAQCVRTLSYTLLLLFDARCQSLSRLSLYETSSLFILLSFSHAREQIRLSCALFVLAIFQSKKLCSLAICMSVCVCVMYVCTYVCAQQNHDYRVGVCVCERVFEGIVRFAVDFVNFCHSIASASTSAWALALASTLASLWGCNCLFNFSFCPIRFANDARLSERANRPSRYTAYSAEKRSSC